MSLPFELGQARTGNGSKYLEDVFQRELNKSRVRRVCQRSACSLDPTSHSSFNSRGEIVEDFGITNRLLNSKTGQLLITVAGIRAAGSDAAAQLVSNKMFLADALRSAPSGWKDKNIQFVVKTDVVDSVAGPPQVVAAYFW